MNEYQNQIGALKQEKEEDLRQQRELRNKIKTLTDRVEDLEHEEEISERKKQEVGVQVQQPTQILFCTLYKDPIFFG